MPDGKTCRISFSLEGENLGEILLTVQSQNTFFVSDSHFLRGVSPKTKEQCWKLFCEEAKDRRLLLLLSCRPAQNFFAQHPEYSCLISCNTKIKPGF